MHCTMVGGHMGGGGGGTKTYLRGFTGHACQEERCIGGWNCATGDSWRPQPTPLETMQLSPA